MKDPIELPRLLARFKLQVRRLLNQTVDLEKLSSDPEYARERLALIEDCADDEDLLVLVLRLREMLCPRISPPTPPVELAVPEPVPTPPPAQAMASGRDYRFGARGW